MRLENLTKLLYSKIWILFYLLIKITKIVTSADHEFDHGGVT
jgi:hypothetical protein